MSFVGQDVGMWVCGGSSKFAHQTLFIGVSDVEGAVSEPQQRRLGQRQRGGLESKKSTGLERWAAGEPEIDEWMSAFRIRIRIRIGYVCDHGTVRR